MTSSCHVHDIYMYIHTHYCLMLFYLMTYVLLHHFDIYEYVLESNKHKQKSLNKVCPNILNVWYIWWQPVTDVYFTPRPS